MNTIDIVVTPETTSISMDGGSLTMDDNQLANSLVLLFGALAHMEEGRHESILTEMERLTAKYDKECPLCHNRVSLQ